MANKILSESFKVFTKYGYNDGIDDFVKLVNSNPDALNDAYEQYKNDAGFEGTIEEYAAALNQKPATVKKKEQEPSGMESPSEDGSSEQSTPQQPEPPKKPRTYGTLNLPGIAGALRTGQLSIKERAAIVEFAKKTGTIKEKPKPTGKTPPSEGEVLAIAFQRVEQEEKEREEFEKEQEKVDKPKLVDPTLAAIPQRDVLRESPALISKEQIQQKVAEAAEDAKATQQYKERQRILTTLQFARDKEKEFEQRKEREQEAAELLASTDFNNVLNGITPGLIDQEETKVASELTNRLARFGFSFSEADPGFNAIYVTAKKSGGEIPSIQINLGAEDAEQRLKNFIKQYASKPYQYTPTDRQIDIEGQQFYASRGLDYKNERARQDEYYNIRDKRIAAESIDPDDPTTYNETMRQKFPDLFTSTGAPRLDLDQLSKDLLVQEDALYATIFDKGVSRDVREQWDVELEKKRKEAAATAAIKNNAAKTAIRDLDVYLTSTLGITIDQLPKYKPKTQEEADIANEVIRKYVEAAKISKEAATQYQLSQLYFDEKVNKAVQGEYVENLEGVYKSIHDGWKEGKTGQVLTLVAEGIYDRTDIVSARDAAQIIVDAQLAKYNQQSAVMGRADAAVSTREYIDAILEDPFEYVTTLFGTSIAQMLPTFMVIAPQTVTAGAAIGGLSTRTPQGAIGGAIGGLKRAQELTEFAVEIGSSFGEAMKNNKLDILNPDDVAFALNNEAIWGETVDLGAGRGIAIALTQFVANKIAGRVFKFDDYASQARKVGTQVAERLVVDPVTEGLGEAVAQLVSAGDIDFKEVSAEALGGTFSNVTGMAANIYMDTQGKANIEIADNLTNIEYVANETASDERISNWANNMHRLGKIDADVNQRIQENIGHKRSAENLLDVGADKRERKDKSPLVARMMKLLAAEKELSSTEERRKVFSEKLSAIRKEQAYIADKQQLAPDDAKVDVDAIIKEQPQPGNYSYNGRRMTKAQFTERIEKMSPQKLANAVARKRLLVTGDPEVVKTINDKLNAVQKPTTKEGVLRQEGPEVELREMGERDAEGQAPQAPITYTQEEVTKRKDELTTQLEQLTKEAEAAPDDAELAGRVAEVKQQVAGMEAIGRRLKTQENVKQSIKSVYPDLEVVEVNNAKEMEDYVAANVGEKARQQMIGGEGGMIIFGADGKPQSIIINNEVADSTTMPHEAWHGLLIKAFGEDPKLFGEFRDAINKTLRDNGFGDIADELDKFVEEGQYEGDAMAEEWLVQFGGMLVAKGIDPSNLKPKERTLLEQIKDIINQFAERITGQPLFLKDATPENILDFMVAISEKMSKGESVAQFFEGTEERAPARKVKKQIIGEKAQLAQNVRDNLQVARDMEEAGKDVKTIRLATGWERGADGLWRYEIPEGEYKRNLFTIIKEKTTGLKIKDVYQNKELYRSYPQLADIPFETRKLEVGVNGFFDGNRIVLNETLVTDDAGSTREKVAMSTIIHELQHVIQDIEGFVRGGSPEATVDLLSKNLEVLNDSILNIEEYVNKYGWDKWTKITGDTKEMLESDKSLANTISKELVKADAYGKFDLYKRLAGEVEARNVERRMGMTPEQRRQVPLVETEDVARESQVFMNLSGVIQPPKAKFSRKKTMVIDGKEVEVKAPALQTVEATAKALEEEVKKESVIKNLGYVPYEKAIIVEAQTEFKNLPKGEGEGVAEARSRMMREQESTPPKFTQYPIGTRAIDKFGEVVELREVPLDEVVSKDEGTQSQETIDKYAKWIKEGKSMPPAKGVENFAVENGKVKITDGNHRYAAAKKAGLKSLPIWVALTDAENVARPVYARNEIAEAYHAAKADGSNPELVNAVEELLGGEEKKVKFSRKVTKEEASDIFKSHPKLSKIGTPEQYSRYLDTIFPDTKQGGVFYHKTMASRAPKDGKFKGYVTYFSSDKDYKPMGLVADVTIPVVLNIQNPLYAENEMFDAPEEVHRKGEYTAPRVVKSDNLGYDSVIGKDAGQEKGYSIAVFEPGQIHQIGTPKDESAFRRFVIADKVKSVGRFVSGLFTEEKEKKVKFSRKPIMTDVVNGFYSPLENAVAAVKQDKMPAKQWMKYTNMEEAKWTGLNDWLSEQSGSLTKGDILKYLKDNRIEIREVELKDKLREYGRKRDEALEKANELLLRALRIEYNMGDYEEADALRKQSDALKAEADDMESLISSGDIGVKHPDYQLGGDKDDYKEVLVTLPKKLPIPDGNYIVYADKGAAERREYIKGFDTENEAFNWVKQNKDKYPYTIDYETRKIVESIESGDVFKSSHFDEPNILVHLRMNTRTDADGNKVLFLEEVQSDWGQEGKKKGFDLTEKEVKDKFDQADAALKSVEKKIDTKYGKDWDSRGDIEDVLSKEDYSEYQKAASERAKWGNLLGKEYKTGTPTAPYVMNTSDWVKLGLKVALKEAEKQGADYIAWTTGEQQNDRYDLSKQVNKIDVESVEAAEGLFYVDIELSSGDTEDFAVGDGIIRTGSYQGRRLEDVVGKEYAEKILSTPRGESVTLQGQDLKLGGKGMKSFYDKIVPDVAKAVIKDVTGTPGEITSVTIETDKGKSTQMAIAVTPEVKGAVKGGMAKFSRKKQDQKPPSVAKLLGITDKKIEIKEKTALANQLKAEARGARNAVKAWKDRAKLLADELKQLKGSNKINQPQYIAALRALVKVNIFNEDSISKFVDYVTKVINNAEYAKQIADLRKALPVAKKNVDRKLGMQPNLQAVLKKVFAVSPSMIPDAVFDKYVNLVNMIGERARVLNLDEQSSIMADATAIATMIDHEQFLAQMLKDAFDNYRDKVLDSNGDVDYQKTIEKMVSDGIIQPSDIELMKKYKGVIVPKEPKTEAEIQAEAAEREQERQDFISSIPGQTVTPSNLSTPDEKAGAKELIELSKDEQVLERMTLEQLRNLDKVLDNIANGFYPAYAHTLKEVMNGIKSSDGVRKAMPKIKIPAIRSMIGKLKAALMKGENMYYHVLSKVPLYIIDQQLGNYKTSPIYKNIFEKVAIAQSKLVSKQKQLLSQLDKAADAVFKEAKRDPDKARMSEYRIFTYLLHREFMSNPGAKGVADAVNFIKATIEYHEENGDTAQVNSRDVEMLQKILDQYESNGKLDFAKLERSLTPKERAYVDALDKVNNEVYPMAEYTASVLRGESVPMLNNYVHHRVLPSKKAVGEQPNELMKANQRMNPSSRSGSLISREPGVKPLNFKVFSTQKAAVNSVLVDRFMTEPIRTTRRMFESLKRSLKDDGMLRGHNRDIVAALEMAFEKANEALLTNNLMYDTFMDEVISSVRRDAYRALLARPTRAIVEYASNLSAALTKSTGAFIDGMSMKGAMSQEELGAFMYSVNSAQVSRVMPSSDMSSKFIDFGATGPAIGRQGSTANSSLANRMQTIYNRTLRRYKGGVDSVADALISTPDKAVSQPVWTGSFYNQFKKITGVNPDKDKIISGDEAYMERYKDAIKSATEKADEEVFMLSSVDNPYMGILNTLKSANDSPMRKAYKMFNNFLTRFQINDYVNARAAVNAMVNNGKMSKADGARLLVAVTLRSVVYIALGKIVVEAMLSAIVKRHPEEEDDRSYMEITGNALASSMTTLMLGRAHGNLLRGVIGMGVEDINEKHLDFMRRGAYDPSRDAIQFGLIPKYTMDNSQGFGVWDVIKSMSGPFNPMLNTIDNALKASTKDLKEPDAIRRAEQTLMIRTPFELLGNRGWIPAYGDIRKIIVADINKGIGKKAKPKEPTWRELPKSERAEIRRLDPKAADEMIKEQKEIDRINKMIRKQEQRYR